MTLSIHILHGALANINSLALAFPFRAHRRKLNGHGLSTRLFHDLDSISRSESDIIILDSKYFRDCWLNSEEEILRRIELLRERANFVLWFNTSDGTGTIQQQVMELVDRYYKSQLLKDRGYYQTSIYGDRLFTDYYHNDFGIQDSCQYSSAILTDEQVRKLRVSWNLGMAPGFTYSGNLYAALLAWIGLRGRVTYQPFRKNRSCLRPVSTRGDVFGRISTSYDRETIAFQRNRVGEILVKRSVGTARVSRHKYFRELQSHLISVSPFGWGEVCIRDFETILSGPVLLKPDMAHVETYPNIYIPFETYVPFNWNLGDLEEKIEFMQARPKKSREIAENAYREYCRYIGREGGELFVNKIANIVDDLCEARSQLI
jgi:hypothetical protein